MKWLLDYFFMIDDWRELSDSDLTYLALLGGAIILTIIFAINFW
ncbi:MULTISPECIES: hypothetical protein [Bacillales]|uniref:Uncharacterized protein n=1 Tax=Lysinibacillus louembei TaxID=1470088 RepID=A0ABZ0RVV0_9BACI|nr:MULTISPECIES: hypothetical protein [Bacillales]WPK12285.1 hypothetical protein R6U77_00940 [Lysinibacillus louembei]